MSFNKYQEELNDGYKIYPYIIFVIVNIIYFYEI